MRFYASRMLAFRRRRSNRLASAVLITIVAIPFAATGSARMTSPVSGPPNANWRRCVAKDEEFSILMPGTPTLFVTSITTSAVLRIPERVYSTYANGSAYLVVSYNASTLDGTFQNYRAHHLFQGEATFERDVQLAKYKGRQYQLKFGNVVGMLQVFSTKRHGYAIATIQAREDPALSEYFFSSLQLMENGAPAVDQDANTSPPAQEASNLPVGITQQPSTGKDLTRKVVVVSKPEPWFTEEARRANTAGSVVLRVVLSATGEVTNIHAVSGLSQGLTEQAVEAAKSLRFIPAEKDGKFVSCWMELQYNFNLF